jgi:hypothetical protein
MGVGGGQEIGGGEEEGVGGRRRWEAQEAE